MLLDRFSPNGGQVLLVEDNPGDIRLVQEAFKEGGFPCKLHVTRDGEQAMAFLHQEPPYADSPRPTLILLDLNLPRKDPPLLIPSDTLVVRPEGTLVALVGAGNVVHFQRILVGRDFGDRIEVLSGMNEGERAIVNPNDSVQEGVRVQPVAGAEGGAKRPAKAGSH